MTCKRLIAEKKLKRSRSRFCDYYHWISQSRSSCDLLTKWRSPIAKKRSRSTIKRSPISHALESLLGPSKVCWWSKHVTSARFRPTWNILRIYVDTVFKSSILVLDRISFQKSIFINHYYCKFWTFSHKFEWTSLQIESHQMKKSITKYYTTCIISADDRKMNYIF